MATGQHGGKRPNSGRKPGSHIVRTAVIAQLAASQGITPLEVLINAMRYHYDEAIQASGDATVSAEGAVVVPKAQHYAFACEYARHAAPYLHPRLSAVEVTGKDGGAIEHSVNVDREQRALDMLTVVRKRAKASN